MSEMMVSQPNITFSNYVLSQKTRSIVVALRDNNRNSLKIAGLLAEIHNNNLYMDDFESFEAYAAQVFGIKKAQAYNLVTIGANWVAHDEKGRPLSESVLPHTQDCDWQVTKLLVLQRNGIDPETAVRLLDNGVISQDMSVSKLTAALKDWKETKALVTGTDEAEDEETDSDEETGTNEPDDAPSKVEYIDMVKQAMDKNNELFKCAQKATVITMGTRPMWSAAHDIANTAFDIMNDLYFGVPPRFFNYDGVVTSMEALVRMIYMHGVNDTAKATAGIDEAERREQLKSWQTAIDSVISGLNSFLTLYKEETGKERQ